MSLTLLTRPVSVFAIDPKIWLMLSEQQEKLEQELSRAADDRARVRAMAPTLAGQVWPDFFRE